MSAVVIAHVLHVCPLITEDAESRNHSRNLQISRAPLKSQAQGVSLFTSSDSVTKPSRGSAGCVLYWFLMQHFRRRIISRWRLVQRLA